MKKQRLKKLLYVAALTTLSWSCAEKVSPEEAFIDDLISKMSIEEKTSQLRIVHASNYINLDKEGNLVIADNIKERLKYGIAGIKNAGGNYPPELSAKLNNMLQDYIVEQSPSGIPALFITESYNGVDARGCTEFARPITLSSTWNLDLVHEVYDCIGREARMRGLHMTHSPEADIIRDPRFGRMSEAFGEDTFLVTEMIANAVSGLQGDCDGLDSTHIGAVVKHYVAYGQIAGGRNFASIEISPRTLRDEIMQPFKAAVMRSGSLGVMASHGDINGVSCHANKEILTDVLRGEWGFEGYVVSDADDVSRLHSFMRTAESMEEATIEALTSGLDIDLYGTRAYVLLPEIVKKNPEIEKYMDQAVKRVLMTKMKLGLFDNYYIDPAKAVKVKDEDAKALAIKADREAIILLKNEDNALPLTKKKKTIALVGPTVSKTAIDYFKSVAGDDVTFIVEKGFPLTNKQGKADGDGDGVPNDNEVLLTTPERCEPGIKRILEVVKRSDAVILFVGGDAFTSREAYYSSTLGDRSDIDLVGSQDDLINRVVALGKPTIGVLKHRRTLSANNLVEKVDALIDCWELSAYGDQAIAEVIFGDVNPSGKLPVTVPRTIGQLPYHYSQKEINYKKGYLFIDNTPLFPFGYGLSYSNFEYSDLKVSSATMDANSSITVSVNVTNTSEREGKEVVQMYIKDLYGEVTRPNMELKGIEKLLIGAKETKRVEFEITPDMLKYTGLSMELILDPGDYKVFVGGNSRDLLVEKFKLVGNK
ncbi:MAG: glycoside hydrolase family 3 N-terminal domain-containing protein [Rikenellaceae bacterium]